MSTGKRAARAGRHENVQAPCLRRALQCIAALVYACLLLACASNTPAPQLPAAPVAGASRPHTVALLGATGMVGDFLLREALERGYSVRALARSPAKLDAFRGRITIVQGDARDPAVIAELLRGSDVVISALGPVKADGTANLFINTIVTGNVLQAMVAQDISRYVVVSGAGVVLPSDQRDLLGWWIRTLAQVGLRDALQDKQAEYELLSKSTADWTLVRCPLIDAESFHAPALVSVLTPTAFRVRAGEVARFTIDEIDFPAYSRQGPFLGSLGALSSSPAVPPQH
jgi:putative NADH-flavin reductase